MPVKSNIYQFRVAHQNDGSATIFLYEEIYRGMAGMLNSMIEQLKAKEVQRLNFRISSLGGDLHTTNTMYNSLKNCGLEVHTYNDGLAASGGSVLLMAAPRENRHAARNSTLMMHNVQTWAEGDYRDLIKRADSAKKLTDVLLQGYVNDTDKTAEEIEQMMDNETFLTAEECLEMGIIGDIYDSNVEPVDATVLAKPELNLFAAHYKKYHKITNSRKMEFDPTLIGLPADADQATIAAKLADLNKAAQLNAQLQKQNKAMLDQQIKAKLDQAQGEGKFLPGQRGLYEATLRKDFEHGCALIDSMASHVQSAQPTQVIKGNLPHMQVKDQTPSWKDKTFKELDKVELEDLREKDWDQYCAKFKTEFGYVPPKSRAIEL